MHQITMLAGLKFHVFTPHSDAFSRFLGSFAKIGNALFRPNLKETCGMMANLVAESGENMGQLTALVPYARISEDMTKGKSEDCGVEA